MAENSSGEASVHRASTSLWSWVWKARVPNKVKIFSWRAYQNILPTRDNLVQRRVMDDASCCFCHRATEMVLHVLWECGAAWDVWAGSAIKFQKFETKQVDFRQLVASLMPKLSLEKWDLFWVICYQIWLQRNMVLHGGAFQHLSRSHQRALDYLREFVDAQDHLSVPVSVHIPASQAWQPL